MKTITKSALLFLCIFAFYSADAQFKAKEAIKLMARGINIGNTMEPPQEGGWGNSPITESLFDDYKAAGFTSVRIPIRWDEHTLTTSPYTINANWLSRVEQVIDWGLSKGLFIIINAHHEEWIKNTDTYESKKARFDSIWSQIAVRFKDKSDKLLFEIINEPTNGDLEKAGKRLTVAQVNEINARVLGIIRITNPTRIVVYSGEQWSNSDQMMAAAIPNSEDEYLMAYYHSYDPYPFGLEGTGTYGSAATITASKAKFQKVKDWSVKNNIPVYLGEFAAHEKAEYNSRMLYYATITELALEYGVAFNVWDDGGWFKCLDRSTHKWNDIKDILIYTYKESPNKLKLTLVNDTNIQLSWTNRTTLNDSIIVERKTVPTASFMAYDTIAPDANTYYDSLLKANTNYYYRLRSKIKDSIQIYSYPVTIKTVLPTQVNLFELGNSLFSIYPNPSNGLVTINSSNANWNSTLEVFDLLGKLRHKQTLSDSETKVSLNTMDKGVYFFKLSNLKNSETHKLVLQ